MDEWADGWVDGRAGLRIAYSNQKFSRLNVTPRNTHSNEDKTIFFSLEQASKLGRIIQIIKNASEIQKADLQIHLLLLACHTVIKCNGIFEHTIITNNQNLREV